MAIPASSQSKGIADDNYIYLYHTDTLIFMPEYADSINDSTSIQYNSQQILTRTSPIYSYAYSGPRQINLVFNLHRDVMSDLNVQNTWSQLRPGEDYMDCLIREIQAAALPSYSDANKLVNPPIIAARFGSDIFIKGVIQGSVGVTYKYPIIPAKDANGNIDHTKHKYANVDISFNISEIDPYDAEQVIKEGSFRGLSMTLDRKVQSALSSIGAQTSFNTISSSL